MPNQMHPRLAELERQAAEAEANPTTDEVVETPSEEVVAEVPATPVPEPTAEVVARDDEEDHYVKLDKRNAYQSLREASEKEKALKDAISTMVGRKAKAQYEPELEALKVELAAARAELRRREFEKLTDAEVSQRFGTDPQFAREYTEAVHSRPVDVNAVRQAQQIRSMFGQELERAENNGVPIQRLAQVENWIRSGAFDRTPDGRVLTPIESYRWVREVVDGDINIHQQATIQNQGRAPVQQAVAAAASAAAAPVEEKKAPAPNPKLQDAAPDLSAGSHSKNSGMQRISRSEYFAMKPPERAARWETHEDFVREVNAGLFTD